MTAGRARTVSLHPLAGFAIVGGMYAAFLLLGWLGARRARASDLILGGRALPLWLGALTMTATWVDGGYLLGTAEGAFRASPASAWQGGVCFGLSLVLGGLFFAGRMRARGYTTLIDPFAERFGQGWAAVLAVPAVLGEVFWSAELLVAVGASTSALLGVRLDTAVLVSAAIVVAYTVAGGLWAVAYADVLQLALVAVGMSLAVPYALDAAGGLAAAWSAYTAAFPDRGGLWPPVTPGGSVWTLPAVSSWWDVSVMLLLGGIPWNCYFQRVLACETPARARQTSIAAGLMTIVLVGPPLVLGVAAAVYPWDAAAQARLAASPAEALPLLLGAATPAVVALLGLGAIIGAVTSSFSASVLSAASMASWNGLRALARDVTREGVQRALRLAIVLVGAVAALLALRAQSVQALWYFTSDLVFVLLFPQLVAALYDPRATRLGSMAAFGVSLVLRLGGGEPLVGLPPFIPYPELLARVFPGDPTAWYDASGAMQWPFRILAAAAGLVVLPVVSRVAGRRVSAR
jgi:high affinity choline transporter 7